MKRIFKYILLLCLPCLYSGCDILEVTPMEFTAPDNFYKTDDELTSALYGVYFYMNNIYIGEYNNIILGDLGTDVTYSRAGQFVPVFQYYRMDSPTVEFSYAWRDHYAAIGAANMLISRAQKSPVEGEYKEQVIAEAKVLRAYFYHNLILLWGDVPLWTDELDVDVMPNLPRSPKSDVVKQIYDDLNTAIPHLPDSYSSEDLGRITSWAAKSLWARISLLQGDYETAYIQAKDVIDNSPHELLLNYADVFDWHNEFNSELIFVTPKQQDCQGSTIHTCVSPQLNKERVTFDPLFESGQTALRPDGVRVSSSESLFQGFGNFVSFNSYINSFEDGDTRVSMVSWNSLQVRNEKTGKERTVSLKGIGKSKHYILKWMAFDEPNKNGGRDIHHIRLAELYLILAEAANEKDLPDEAIAALNNIRKRAFGDDMHNYTNTDAASQYYLADKNAIKEAIINENKWELGAEGVRRWYLIHWGYDYLYGALESLVYENNKGQQVVENAEALKNIKPYHVLFKIPVQEFVKNPNLGNNNPGYE